MEAWLARSDSRISLHPKTEVDCDFWRASLSGESYTIKGYQADADFLRPSINAFYLDEQLAMLSEGILFADRLAELFGNVEYIGVLCLFNGLQGRQLWTGQGTTRHMHPNMCSTGRIVVEEVVSRSQIQDDLAGAIHQMMGRKIEAFDLYELSSEHVRNALLGTSALRNSTARPK